MNLFETEKDMLETPGIMRRFDAGFAKKLAEELAGTQVFFSGLGSSYMFPCGNAARRILKFGVRNARVAWATDLIEAKSFANSAVFMASNSGRTKEAVLAARDAKQKGAKIIAVTEVPDSVLAKEADDVVLLKCGKEKGVAATKSVVEQALVYDLMVAALAEKKLEGASEAAKCVEKNLGLKIDDDVSRTIGSAERITFAGADFGVGFELGLKFSEATGGMVARFLPGNLLIHGYEEGLTPEDAVILFYSTFMKRDLEDYARKLAKTGAKVLGDAGKRQARLLRADKFSFSGRLWRVLPAVARLAVVARRSAGARRGHGPPKTRPESRQPAPRRGKGSQTILCPKATKSKA